jgi:hypothetical protein
VDDDDSVRVSLEWLIRRAGWQPNSFASAAEFLACPRCPTPSCLLLDLTLPEKPFCDDDLLKAIPRAFEISACALRDQARLEVLQSRYASLTPREREVMGRIVFGQLNKQVAAMDDFLDHPFRLNDAVFRIGAKARTDFAGSSTLLHAGRPEGRTPATALSMFRWSVLRVRIS